jgi:hypothetical protein
VRIKTRSCATAVLQPFTGNCEVSMRWILSIIYVIYKQLYSYETEFIPNTYIRIKKIKELSERAHIPHAPHIDRSNAKFLK